MGIVKNLHMKKKEFYKLPKIELKSNKPTSFDCNDVMFLPVKSKHQKIWKKIDVVLCQAGEPTIRLTGNGEIVFIEHSTRSFKIDIPYSSGLTRLFPTLGKLCVEWDGTDLHIKRIPLDDETV